MDNYPELEPLKAGDRVGLVSPSGPSPEHQVVAAEELLKSWNLIPVRGENVLARHPRAKYLAGTDEQRTADLEAAWTDDSLRAVFCIRGGYGTVRLLDRLDATKLRAAKPKMLIGSSDVTGLHEYWEHQLNVATLFAPMISTNAVLEEPQSAQRLHDVLFDGIDGLEISHPDAQALVPGVAHGTITGGNLSLLAMTTGAHPQELQRAAGKIVLIEEVTEDVYRVDGLLMKLLRSGYFEGAAGIAFGTWEQCGELSDIKALVEELLSPLGIPMVWGLRFGHGSDVVTLPLGVPATLYADEQPRLSIG